MTTNKADWSSMSVSAFRLSECCVSECVEDNKSGFRLSVDVVSVWFECHTGVGSHSERGGCVGVEYWCVEWHVIVSCVLYSWDIGVIELKVGFEGEDVGFVWMNSLSSVLMCSCKWAVAIMNFTFREKMVFSSA